MEKNNVKKIIYSSSATVYGTPLIVPIDETHICNPINVYGRTKLMSEHMIIDWTKKNKNNSSIILRYFNPLGAHASGLIGENPKLVATNIGPKIMNVINKDEEKLYIFGNDYETSDGTCIRDFIHINDLVEGHIKALRFCLNNSGNDIFNLGTGKGYSVLKLVKMFEKMSGKNISFNYFKRRDGDTPICIANPSKANKILKWKAKHGLKKMCIDTINFSINKN